MARSIILPDTKFKDTEFYKWLQAEYEAGRKHTRFVDGVLKYFNKPQPFKHRSDMQYHKWVHEDFLRNKR